MSEHWQNRANCVGVEPELFFPTSRNDSAKDAKRICRNCPVQRECAQSARDNGEEFGVWGGRTEQERNGPRPAKQPSKREKFKTAENVAFVLRSMPDATTGDVAERLGVTRDAVRTSLLRAGRDDLRIQLDRNAGRATNETGATA
jgi:WhiB family redox-sensing transcriptional regulator